MSSLTPARKLWLENNPIRRLRRRWKWSHRKLAEAAGISVRGLQYIESGERNPKPETMWRICEALRANPLVVRWEFLHWCNGTPVRTPTLAAMRRAWRIASPTRLLRQRIGLTQAELASEAGLCRRTICAYESPAEDLVHKNASTTAIARALEVDPMVLFVAHWDWLYKRPAGGGGESTPG